MEERLPLFQKIAYSLGHGYNDLLAAYTWSYLILYIQLELKFGTAYIGYYILVEQLSDCIMEIVTGFLSDRCNGCLFLGKRKSWYLLGTVVQTVGFILIFCIGVGVDGKPDGTRFFYYVPLIFMYSGGMGIVLVCHLSILPEISSVRSERVQMHGWRNAVQAVGNVSVYGAAFVFLYIDSGSNPQISKADGKTLQNLAIFCVVFGMLFVTIFTFAVKEKRTHEMFIANNDMEQTGCRCTKYINNYHTDEGKMRKKKERTKDQKETYNCNIIATNAIVNETTGQSVQNAGNDSITEQATNSKQDNHKIAWLKSTLKGFQFYAVTIIFSCARLAVTTSQLYMPLYTTGSLHMDKVSIAILPFIVYISGFIASLFIHRLDKKIGEKPSFIVGCVATVASCVWIYFISKNSYQQIYPASVVFGVGSSATLVTATAMITNLIGQKTEYGATIYGIIGAVEKLSQGVGFMLVQNFNPCNNNTQSSSCVEFYKVIMVGIPGVATLLSFITLSLAVILKRM